MSPFYVAVAVFAFFALLGFATFVYKTGKQTQREDRLAAERWAEKVNTEEAVRTAIPVKPVEAEVKLK